MEVLDYYDEVSLRLMQVLDTVGLREKVRWKRIEMWTQVAEITSVLTSRNHMRTHVFGSQAEASTTDGLNSDTDIVQCLDYYITVLNELQSWKPGPSKYLMVMDDTTPPGYVKLQNLFVNVPLPVCNQLTEGHMLDRFGRSCLHNNHSNFKLDACEHHGPANTVTEFGVHPESIDRVYALKNLSWPHIASEWITRTREHNWPTQETVSTIVQSGTLLVPIGHKFSPEKHLEWRISLSYGEKILVWKFNSAQYKCFILLKMINKYFIKPMFGENVLTSYHWKTCMFYMIEATPSVLWQPPNLVRCIELCLMKVCTWVEEYNCPNYFIPAENMFLGKLYGPIQRDLATMLHYLLRQNGRYLTLIPYEGIGLKLNMACQSPITPIGDGQKYISTSLLTVVKQILSYIIKIWFNLLRDVNKINSHLFKRLSSSNAIQQEICIILWRFYCSNLGSYLASKCLKEHAIDQERLDMAHEFLLLGASSDVASGKLKLAAFHLLLNNLTLTENILHNIEENFTFFVSNAQSKFTKCLANNRFVYEHYDYTDIDYLIVLKTENENISTTDLVRYYFAFPVPYLPSEMYFTPRALIPEMFRLTGSDQGSLDPDLDFWAIVDPKFYLHFLQHRCYHQQNKIPNKIFALSNMVSVIQHKKLRYKDTALNMLAYCLKEDGLLVQSYAVLSKSMKLNNNHNAAKWQLACLINAAFRWLGRRN